MTWLWIVWVLIVIFGIVAFRGAPYVPSMRRDIQQAFTKLYTLTDKDVLVDVGSGDGVILRVASRQGAKAIGYELNPILVAISRMLSIRDKKVRIKLTDFWLTPLPDDTTIVYGFIVTRDVKKMTQKMTDEATRLNRPVRYMSYGSKIESLTPDASVGAHNLYTFYPLHSK